ncbi:MAG: nucleotidyltransferase [Desulfocapsa sp.]|nr:MAG: nucleotidyltransferase [Desulfocapsa sp.]
MKVATYDSRGEVIYTEKHWKILKAKRERAKEVMSRLKEFGIDSIVYGSVARGDVSPSSDVDIFVPYQIPSYRLEIALEDFEILERRIVQATPNYAIKGEFVLSDNTTVSFPLVKLKEKELDFYRFGGCISYEELLQGKRVPGVDKRLVLIIPTERGHFEVPVSDVQPSYVAKILGICLDIVKERIRVLERRREVGRTGIFLCEVVPSFTSFEAYLMEIAKENPMVRKRLNA